MKPSLKNKINNDGLSMCKSILDNSVSLPALAKAEVGCVL